MSIFKDKVHQVFAKPGAGLIMQAIAASIDLGYYIGKLEIRYGLKSQALAKMRRENFDLKAEKSASRGAELRHLEARVRELEARVIGKAVGEGAIETIELNGANIRSPTIETPDRAEPPP